MMVAIKNTKFRNDNNQRYTKQLFWDMQREMPIADRLIDPMYSLHDDVEGVINFRRCYVEDMDTTGYKTANRLLENYDHWNLLMRGKWFKEAKAEWDKEIAARMEQEATDTLMAIIRLKNEDVKVSEQISAAAKVFSRVDKMNNPNSAAMRGRPSKEEVKGKLKEEARLSKEEQEDADRIMKVVKK